MAIDENDVDSVVFPLFPGRFIFMHAHVDSHVKPNIVPDKNWNQILSSTQHITNSSLYYTASFFSHSQTKQSKLISFISYPLNKLCHFSFLAVIVRLYLYTRLLDMIK